MFSNHSIRYKWCMSMRYWKRYTRLDWHFSQMWASTLYLRWRLFESTLCFRRQLCSHTKHWEYMCVAASGLERRRNRTRSNCVRCCNANVPWFKCTRVDTATKSNMPCFSCNGVESKLSSNNLLCTSITWGACTVCGRFSVPICFKFVLPNVETIGIAWISTSKCQKFRHFEYTKVWFQVRWGKELWTWNICRNMNLTSTFLKLWKICRGGGTGHTFKYIIQKRSTWSIFYLLLFLGSFVEGMHSLHSYKHH